ncbi:MAG: OmpH family outer membrane protein [Candidatus Eremiobacteraeota bacterium]|nr:OmpH family outer membrane protein [Candidatus Eremiobacteraeota bacterium]
MSQRFALLIAFGLLAALGSMPAAIGADVTDVGYVDQAELASLPVFVNANRQLAAIKSRLDAQYSAQTRHARSDAERQQVGMQFQQQLNDRQREIVGPLVSRAQLAIAAVSASRNVSVVVDKRIIIYGGQDITKDVVAVFASSQAIAPPAATPPPAEIGFVDQSVLDGVPKVQTANNAMTQFEATQRQIYSARIAAAKTNNDKQALMTEYNKAVSDKQNQLLKPLVDQTKNATADVARKKHLMLIVDRADVIYGGVDITTDVQNELSK